ncbi:MAG: 16S rRNA (cytosine(1402)-N(4))-methyltransferase RsmH [Firmicutes bacterium]|nr:16S rRNA (cytosine(1402)-N(4))-methyltransferase RsmH [Bacillota bacterium]
MSEHISVLLQEAVEALNVKPNGIYVDMTLGGGGHSEQILKRLENGRLFCFDQDEYAISKAKERLHSYSNITYVHSNFENLVEEMNSREIDKVDGILFDLGVSSFQFDLPDRGFSYNYDAPLDMRMDQSQSLSAWHVVNEYSFDQILKVLYEFGEESFARNIAKKILERRLKKPIETTFELVDVIKSSLPSKVLRKKGHPAKQTFQAIRIEVNHELDALKNALEDAIKLIRPGGRIVVITFHSLEDRICKKIFKSYSEINIPKGLPILVTEEPVLSLINKKVILPTEEELAENNRAHSAKMRVVQKNHE